MTRDLSPREREVLLLIGERNSTAEVAAILHLSVHTVRSHVKSALRKLGVHNRRDAVLALDNAVCSTCGRPL